MRRTVISQVALIAAATASPLLSGCSEAAAIETANEQRVAHDAECAASAQERVELNERLEQINLQIDTEKATYSELEGELSVTEARLAKLQSALQEADSDVTQGSSK